MEEEAKKRMLAGKSDPVETFHTLALINWWKISTSYQASLVTTKAIQENFLNWVNLATKQVKAR